MRNKIGPLGASDSGPDRAVMREFAGVNVHRGVMEITFLSGTMAAKIGAIKIFAKN